MSSLINRLRLSSQRNADKFGYFGFAPSWLQWINNPWCFLAMVTALTFAQIFAIAGLLIMLMPQIEKRFNLSSFDAGMIFAANDMAAVLFGVIIGHYGNSGNKVRWIGVGGLIIGVGFFIFSLPHLMIERYNPPAPIIPQIFCMPFTASQATNGTQEAAGCVGVIADKIYFAQFLMGQFVAGVGSITLYAFTPSCFEEATTSKNIPIFLGIWQSSLYLAPFVSFLIAKPLLRSYVDIDQPEGFNMTPLDPRWISNWWVGFLAASFFTLLCSFIILGFPARVGGGRGPRRDRQKPERSHERSLRVRLAEIQSTLKALLTNWPFIFNCMAVNTILIYLEGLSPILAKIMMLHFGLAPDKVGDALALCSGPTIPVAFGIAIFITRSFKVEESGRRSALACLIIQILTVSSALAFAIPGCDVIKLAGWKVPYGARHLTPNGLNFTEYPSVPGIQLGSTCNQMCGCNLGIALPVCGSDNITYLSPCYAGCKTPLSPTMFGNCSCIGANDGFGGSASVGYCERNCKNLVLFLILVGFAGAMIYICVTPSKIVIMRCVPSDQLSMAFSIQYMMTKVFAHIPGPVLFGRLVDLNCDVWQKVCDKTGYCWVYDMEKNRMIILTVGLILYGCGVLFFFLSWFLYKDANPQVEAQVTPDVVEKILQDPDAEESHL